MSSVFDSFSSPQRDPFALPKTGQLSAVQPLALSDPELASRPTPLDHWLELTVRWGTSTLATALSAPSVDIVLVPQGDAPIAPFKSKDGTRLLVPLPSELIGDSEVPLSLGRHGHTRILVPTRATGTYRERQSKCAVRRPLTEALLLGTPSNELPGTIELPLLPDAALELEAFGLSLELALVRREKPAGKGIAIDRSYASYLALSLATFGGLFASLAYFTPPLGLEDEGAMDKERLILVQHYLSALAQREEEARQEATPAPESEPGGEASAPAPGKPGEAGNPEAARAPARIAVKGPKDQRNVELSREEVRILAQNFGMIELLNGNLAVGSDAPFSPFARDQAIGHDDLNASGALWGMDIGEAGGQNGLHLSGPGSGGANGPGAGVGIQGFENTLGTLGGCVVNGGANCTGLGGRFGLSGGRVGSGHVAKSPTVRTAAPSVSGRLPAEVVQRTVRQNFGRFRFCYERGLAQNPSLEGRVAVRFVIGRSGAVSTASAQPGGMPDEAVTRCVAQGFLGLSFPPPEGGVVTVTYPLMFSPG